SWQDVTPPELPEWALISIIEASPHDAATAYVAATCYKLDDFQPYLYKTHDYGQTWTKITGNLAANDFTRVIREDPVRRGLLFAGTETGIHVSFDDGAHWQSLRQNLPVVPIHDLVIKDNDLIVATHGRSFWILDDITPLRHLSEQVANSDAYLFPPGPTIRFMTSWGFTRTPGPTGKYFRQIGTTQLTIRQKPKPNGETIEIYLDAGKNPPDGVIVTYYLKEQPEDEIQLTILDAQGQEIRTFSSEEKQNDTASALRPNAKDKEKKEPRIPKDAGSNRFVWDMRYPEATRVDGFAGMDGPLAAPLASPGSYQVRLTIGDQIYIESFEILKDPRVAATQEDLEAQFALRLRIRDKLSETHEAINTIRDIRQQAENWQGRTQKHQNAEAIGTAISALTENLSAIEEELIQVKAQTRQDTLNFPVKLNAKLAALSNTVASADAAPTRQMYELFEDLSARVDAQLTRLQNVIDTDMQA